MHKFPDSVEDKPHMVQLAKEVWESLGCKDPLTRAFIRTTFIAIQVFDWKQGKYGTKNIAAKGGKGVVTRLTDKLSRLDNMYETGQDAREDNEGVEDSFGDIGNYGLIGLMCRWKMWPGSPERNGVEEFPQRGAGE